MVTSFRVSGNIVLGGGGRGGTCKKLIKEFISRFTFYFVKCKVVNHQVRGEQGAEYFGHEL